MHFVNSIKLLDISSDDAIAACLTIPTILGGFKAASGTTVPLGTEHSTVMASVEADFGFEETIKLM